MIFKLLYLYDLHQNSALNAINFISFIISVNDQSAISATNDGVVLLSLFYYERNL
jgi:hypothetical protein